MFDARFFQLKVASLTSCCSSRIANRIKHHRFTQSNHIWIREQQMFHVPCSNWISNPDLSKFKYGFDFLRASLVFTLSFVLLLLTIHANFISSLKFKILDTVQAFHNPKVCPIVVALCYYTTGVITRTTKNRLL
jgi:hypothetical protein